MGKHIIALTLIIGALIGLVSFFLLNSTLLPPLASAQGGPIDQTVRLLLAIAGGIFVLILVLLVYSLVLFRRRPGEEGEGPPILDNPWLVAGFFFIPLGLVLWSASWGAVELAEIQRPPLAHEAGGKSLARPLGQEAVEVRVIAFQWGWQFQYPQWGITSGELVLPVNRPIHYTLTSRDVIHSFWVPEFRYKIDALPGMETSIWGTPVKVGEYRVLCAELCGLGHTMMQARVRVVGEEEFLRWVEEQRR